MTVAKPAMSIAEATALLTGPGGHFELNTEEIRGEVLPVFRDRHRSLRGMLAGASNFGDKAFYTFDTGETATFAEHVSNSAAIAHALRTRHGLEPGDRVGILAANHPQWIQAFWGIVSGGMVAVAMNGWWKSDEIRHGLELTTPKLLIADRARLERIEGDPGIPVIVMDEDFDQLLVDRGVGLPDDPIAEDDPAAILFTSGTTGRPKGAIQTHRNLVSFVSLAFMTGAISSVRFPGDAGAPPVTLNASPLFHVSGLHAGAVASVASGTSGIWTTGRFDPEKVLRLTQEHGITRWGGVTTQIWRLIEHPALPDFDISTVATIGGGGSVWSPDLLEACRAALPEATQAVSVGYGLTESSGLATSAPSDLLAQHPDSVGMAIASVDVRIFDDDDNELPDGVIGNVGIRGANVMPGYWDNPEATAATVRPGGWLRSGDFGRIEHGILYLASRRTDLIIRGGENIYPIEIENAIVSHPVVSDVCVIGVDHRELGQEVKAFVVFETGQSTTTDELADHIRQSLANHKVPAHWEIRSEELPRNPSGKIMRHVLTGESENIFAEE